MLKFIKISGLVDIIEKIKEIIEKDTSKDLLGVA